jgi:hypothetical protein
VGGEDAGDSASKGLVAGVKLLILVGVGLGLSGEVCAIKDERGDDPDVAPPGGEDLGMSSFLGGEKRNYLIEDGIGEAVDAVDVVFAATVAAATTSSFGQRRRWWWQLRIFVIEVNISSSVPRISHLPTVATQRVAEN